MAHVMGMEMPTQPQFSMAQPQGGVDGPRESKPQDEGRIFMGGLSHATTKEQHTLDGRNIDVKAAMPKSRGGSKEKGLKMFIGGIPRETSKEELEAQFSQFGAIEECNYVCDATKGPHGFAFITYREIPSMEKALIVKQVFHGRTVDCKRAQSKEDHEMTMHAHQHNSGMRGPGGMHGGGMGPGAGGPMPRHAQGGGAYGSYSPDGKYQASMSQGGGGGYGPGPPGGAYGVYGGGGAGYYPYGASGYGGWGGGGYGGYAGGYPPADGWQGGPGPGYYGGDMDGYGGPQHGGYGQYGPGSGPQGGYGAGGPGAYSGHGGYGGGRGAGSDMHAPYNAAAAAAGGDTGGGYGAAGGYNNQPPTGYGAPQDGGYGGEYGGGAPQDAYGAANGGYSGRGSANGGYNSTSPGKGMPGPPGQSNWGGYQGQQQRYAPY